MSPPPVVAGAASGSGGGGNIAVPARSESRGAEATGDGPE